MHVSPSLSRAGEFPTTPMTRHRVVSRLSATYEATNGFVNGVCHAANALRLLKTRARPLRLGAVPDIICSVHDRPPVMCRRSPSVPAPHLPLGRARHREVSAQGERVRGGALLAEVTNARFGLGR